MTLYIIGNGFDLQHHLKSSYSNFRGYLENNHELKMLHYFDKYFNLKSNWSDFENKLAKPNVKKLLYSKICFLCTNKLSMHRTNFHDEIKSIITLLTDRLKIQLNNWVNSINLSIPSAIKQNMYSFNTDDYFITFNYTETLEILYGIFKKNICHVHGSYSPKYYKFPDIVIGHNNYLQPSVPKKRIFSSGLKLPRDKIFPKLSDFKCEKLLSGMNQVEYFGGRTLLENYFHETYKYYEILIKKHNTFFNEAFLKRFDTVFISGHSLASVDMPYLTFISKEINKNAKYIITYYGLKNKISTICKSGKITRGHHVKYINTKT